MKNNYFKSYLVKSKSSNHLLNIFRNSLNRLIQTFAKKYLVLVLLLFIYVIFSAFYLSKPKTIILFFIPCFGKEKLVIDKNYYSEIISDSISIQSLRFYVSGIYLLKNGKSIYQTKNQCNLIDISKKLRIEINTKSELDFDCIQFNIGVDSSKQVSGVMGGDLDPMNGMYWTWQSGYINFKLEGKSNICNTRNNIFQFHIGGYQSPNNTIQKIMLPVKNVTNIIIRFDIKNFLSQIDLKNVNEVVSPSYKSVQISKQYANIFSIE